MENSKSDWWDFIPIGKIDRDHMNQYDVDIGLRSWPNENYYRIVIGEEEFFEDEIPTLLSHLHAAYLVMQNKRVTRI